MIRGDTADALWLCSPLFSRNDSYCPVWPLIQEWTSGHKWIYCPP